MLPVAMFYHRLRGLIIHGETYFIISSPSFFRLQPHFTISYSATKSCMCNKLYWFSTKIVTFYLITHEQEQHTTGLAVLDKLSSTQKLKNSCFPFRNKI